MRAVGLNRAESMYRSGAHVIEPVFPARLGYEAAGLIEAVGPGVTGMDVGGVSVVPAFAFTDYGLRRVGYGPARAVVRHPDALGWEEAAATWMQFGTAWGALFDFAGFDAGDVVLIPAASSSVGLAAIQTALRIGAIPWR